MSRRQDKKKFPENAKKLLKSFAKSVVLGHCVSLCFISRALEHIQSGVASALLAALTGFMDTITGHRKASTKSQMSFEK